MDTIKWQYFVFLNVMSIVLVDSIIPFSKIKFPSFRNAVRDCSAFWVTMLLYEEKKPQAQDSKSDK